MKSDSVIKIFLLDYLKSSLYIDTLLLLMSLCFKLLINLWISWWYFDFSRVILICYFIFSSLNSCVIKNTLILSCSISLTVKNFLANVYVYVHMCVILTFMLGSLTQALLCFSSKRFSIMYLHCWDASPFIFFVLKLLWYTEGDFLTPFSPYLTLLHSLPGQGLR